MDYVKKQAPGETIPKVGGMLLLFLGVLLAFGSGNTLSLVMKGSSDSAVVEYLNQNGMTYSQLVASNVMVLVAGSNLSGSWRGWCETGW